MLFWAVDVLYVKNELNASDATEVSVRFMGGSIVRNAEGTAGSSDGEWPGGRESCATWADKSGTFVYLFGGHGFDSISSAAIGSLSDLWRWSFATRSFSWIGGPSEKNQPSFGTGVERWPASRGRGAVWYSSGEDAAYVFGGDGVLPDGGSGILDELWKFSIDPYFVCSTAPLNNVANLTQQADLSECGLKSSKRNCTLDACLAGFFPLGSGSVECVVEEGTVNIVLATESNFSCVACTSTAANPTSCSSSSQYSSAYSCERVYDGNFRNDAGDWATAGEGGGWIELVYEGVHRLDRMEFQQRSTQLIWTTQVRLEFSDGSFQNVDLLQSTEMQSYVLEPVWTSRVRVTVLSVVTLGSNNGAIELVFYGCRDYCADTDVALATDLPPHTDVSGCTLDLKQRSCNVVSCLDGYIGNGSGIVECDNSVPATYYLPGATPLTCEKLDMGLHVNASTSVMYGAQPFAPAGDVYSFYVSLRNDTGGHVAGKIANADFAVTSNIGPCQNLHGDLWHYLVSVGRISACPEGVVSRVVHAGVQQTTWELSLQAPSIPAAHFIRVYLQNRVISPLFDPVLLLGGAEINFVVVPNIPSASHTSFTILADNSNSSDNINRSFHTQTDSLILVTVNMKDKFGNPTCGNGSIWESDEVAIPGVSTVVLDEIDNLGIRCPFKSESSICNSSTVTFRVFLSRSGHYTLRVRTGGVDVVGSPLREVLVTESGCVVQATCGKDPCRLSLGDSFTTCHGKWCVPAEQCELDPCALPGFETCGSVADTREYTCIGTRRRSTLVQII
eukprot:COSAG05_NODE_609_length_8370_cov_4.097328_2_plen_787_part_00